MLNILIIGGTTFVGRHITEEAVKKGHNVTLFNRGISQPNSFPDLKRIYGDRRKDAHKLKDYNWDAVIDTSAYSPADLIPVLQHLQTKQFTFISTISVYNDFSKGAVDEEGTKYKERPAGDRITAETYGALKVMCEETVHERFKGQALMIRPGIVIGPHDPTDRFTYWALRLNEKGPVLLPGSKERKVQWIDGRDLAQFVIRQVEAEAVGPYNVAADPATMEEFVEQVQTYDIDKIWIADDKLLSAGIKPFDIPFWIPVSHEYPEGFLLVDNGKAKEAGLQTRSLAISAEDTRNWCRNERPKNLLKAGITRGQEERLLTLEQEKSTGG